MDEIGWVDFLKRYLGSSKKVIASFGEDCAIVKDKDKFILLSSDLFIEGVHFDLKKISFRNLGKRAVARAVSDIVACAGIPKFLGVSLGISPSLTFRELKSIILGVKEICRASQIEFIGGDTAKAKFLFLDVWVVGETQKYVLRSSAKEGDYIFLTGRLGELKFNQVPHLRIREIHRLVEKFKINAMIDISDGFVLDLWRLLRESGKGALIYLENLPLTRGIRDIYRGEDYELIFTVSIDQDLSSLKKKYFLVGEIKNKEFGYKIKSKERVEKVKIKGFLHF
ncbi:MAG: thiamine-monophosphate kinase [Candidatus Omnitrophica bacterium]|nr:thiamine-monophosphate kinase [Candidatus Omnitrophota bacterium]